MRTLLLLLLIAAGLAPAASALELQVIPRRGAGDWLVAELRVQELLDEELLDAIRSGLPARVRFRVELWRDRSRLWDRLRGGGEMELRLVHDALEEEYRVFDASGNAVLDTRDVSELEELLGLDRMELGHLDDLQPDKRYYLVARVEVQPLSIEEIRDLERWLRGSVREGGGIGSQIFGLLRQRLGLGDRSVVERGESFRPRDLRREGSPR